jgi:hypothetical protein
MTYLLNHLEIVAAVMAAVVVGIAIYSGTSERNERRNFRTRW